MIKTLKISLIGLIASTMLTACTANKAKSSQYPHGSMGKWSSRDLNKTQRSPLYNDKYIKKAQHNMMHHNGYVKHPHQMKYEEKIHDNSSSYNKMLYKQMAEANIRNRPSLIEANARALETRDNQEKLKNELSEIKNMLKDTREKINNCPNKRKLSKQHNYISSRTSAL